MDTKRSNYKSGDMGIRKIKLIILGLTTIYHVYVCVSQVDHVFLVQAQTVDNMSKVSSTSSRSQQVRSPISCSRGQ